MMPFIIKLLCVCSVRTGGRAVQVNGLAGTWTYIHLSPYHGIGQPLACTCTRSPAAVCSIGAFPRESSLNVPSASTLKPKKLLLCNVVY